MKKEGERSTLRTSSQLVEICVSIARGIRKYFVQFSRRLSSRAVDILCLVDKSMNVVAKCQGVIPESPVQQSTIFLTR